MNTYNHARDIGLSRQEASACFQPLLNHPTLSSAAKIMLDIARSDP